MSQNRTMRAIGWDVIAVCALMFNLAQAQTSELSAIPLPPASAQTPLHEDTQDEIIFDSLTPFDFDVLLNQYQSLPKTSSRGFLYLPPGASATNPAPFMVLLPGSGGVKLGRQMIYADQLLSRGYGVLVIDYYESRGIDDDKVPYPLMVTNVTEFDVVTDAFSALKALNNHPSIDPERIGVMGFSYGGMATRLAMDSRLKERLAPNVPAFAVHVDFYGPCFQNIGTTQTTGAPLLTLRGAEDASNDLVACAVEEHRLRAAGSEVSSKIYATAGHSWGNLQKRHMNKSTYLQGCEMIFDEQGFPFVNGVALIDKNASTDRDYRYKLRMNSGQFFEGCVKVGYIVGRDEAVHQDTLDEMFEFLSKNL